MKIKSMTATFGKLDKARLELEDGLNLIQAPNEGGKSTWCAFWKTMLYGIDTRDRDKKGYLADKNKYQPWSGAPMEGEITLEWLGHDITIRRGPKGNTPFGAFSAVYTGTGEPVPGLTGDLCGEMLTGVGREVFERSAFIGSGGSLSVTSTPELEKRIAALVSSGEEDVSYSQTESRLKEWLNRRKVNKSVGLIPKLEEELRQVEDDLRRLEEVTAAISQLEGERAGLDRCRDELLSERHIHQRLAQKELNRRFALAEEDWKTAQSKLTALEQETARFGDLPEKERLKQAQGELQYLKVLDEEIKQGDLALKEADENYVQAQIAAQDELFSGLTADEAAQRVQNDLHKREQGEQRAAKLKKRANLFQNISVLLSMALCGAVLLRQYTAIIPEGPWVFPALIAVAVLAVLLMVLSTVSRSGRKKALKECADILARYKADSPEAVTALVQDYRARCQAADEAAQQAKAVRGTLNDRKAQRDNSHADLLTFVHQFAPTVSDLFGCSAALSRALNLDYELAMARERVEERRRRKDDLAAQGGRNFDTLELLLPPERSPQETEQDLAAASAELERITEALNQARGRQKAMGDPAALSARREELEGQLTRRQLEFDALTAALAALKEANTRLQERFSPELNRLSSQYLARLTGSRYKSVTLTRELEGGAARQDDVLPHSALYLSRGTADQLYLSVRLAVCALCLPEKPPIVLDDALAAFDDHRLVLALELLQELAKEQQVLLFTCQKREGEALNSRAGELGAE